MQVAAYLIHGDCGVLFSYLMQCKSQCTMVLCFKYSAVAAYIIQEAVEVGADKYLVFL